jgi:uncharacterized membrane protein
MNEYNFPFDTCEKKQDIIAQPYSVFVNLINCLIIFYFLNKTKTNHSFYLLGSILLFEMFHTLSHTIHIKGPIQINITHILNYFMLVCFLLYFINITNTKPNNKFIILLIILILLDLY